MCNPDSGITADERQAIIAATAALIPQVAGLIGGRYLNQTLVSGLLRGVADSQGADIPHPLMRDLEAELLRQAFPHRVELAKGPWLTTLPAFVQRDVRGLCTTVVLPLTYEDLDATPVAIRYDVRFIDKTDASVFRLNFG